MHLLFMSLFAFCILLFSALLTDSFHLPKLESGYKGNLFIKKAPPQAAKLKIDLFVTICFTKFYRHHNNILIVALIITQSLQ